MKHTFQSAKNPGNLTQYLTGNIPAKLKFGGGEFFFFLFLRSLAVMLVAGLLSVSSLTAQCPSATYTVGSNAGFSNFSAAKAAFPGLETMTGGSVIVDGSFLIDNAISPNPPNVWTLRGVDVYMTQGASITVMSKSTLDAQDNASTPTVFQLCPGNTVWTGISVSGTLLLKNSNIEDACSAVTLFSSANTEITGSIFDNNFYGIETTGGAPILLGEGIAHNKFNYSGSSCTSFVTPTAIRLNNNTFIRIGDLAQTGAPNEIFGYTFGVSATNANVDIMNTAFERVSNGSVDVAIRLRGTGGVYKAKIIGLGGTATSPTMVKSYNEGISAQNYDVDVSNARFQNDASAAIRVNNSSLPSEFIVSNSYFGEFWDKGIHLVLSSFDQVLIKNNTFKDDFQDPLYLYRKCVQIGDCIITQDAAKGTIEGNDFFEEPKIPSTQYEYLHTGTDIIRTDNIHIEDNDYYQNHPIDTLVKDTLHGYTAISIASSEKNDVVSNRIYGGGKTSGSQLFFLANIHTGISVSASANTVVSCNTVNDLDFGVAFSDKKCDPAFITANEMTSSQKDLYLAPTTTVGVQNKRRNKWPANSAQEALYDGNPSLSDILASRFNVDDPVTTSQFWPIPVTPATNWFVPTAYDPSVTLCRNNDGGGDDKFSKASQMLVEGTYEAYKGYPATIWDATMTAYRQLLDNPSLLTDSIHYQHFFEQTMQSNAGKLQILWRSLQNASALPGELNSFNQARDEQIEAIQSLTQTLQETTDESVQDEVNALIAEKQASLEATIAESNNLYAAYQADEDARIQAMIAELNAIEPAGEWENNLKTVLQLIANRRVHNDSEWSTEQSEQLRSIADQCRHEGGVGVVLARVLLHDGRHNDELKCPGYSAPRNISESATIQAKMMPNPTKGICQVSFDKLVSGIFELNNALGQIVLSVTVDNSKNLTVDVAQLPDGMYFARLRTTEGHIPLQKLSVSH